MGTELQCPSCGPAGKVHAKADGGLACEVCGGTFVFQAGEAKLKDVGELDRVKGDVEQLKEEQRRIQAALAKEGRLAPTEDPDREMPDRDPDEIVVEDDDEEDL